MLAEQRSQSAMAEEEGRSEGRRLFEDLPAVRRAGAGTSSRALAGQQALFPTACWIPKIVAGKTWTGHHQPAESLLAVTR